MKYLYAAVITASFPILAAAQATQPDAGTLLRQVEPVLPVPSRSPGTGLTIEQGGIPPVPPGVPFAVRAFQVTGNSLIDTPTLQALVADAEGKSLSLAQLVGLAGRITALYQSRGYPLARAIIPAQAIAMGVVRIEVIEARYGTTVLDNRSPVDDKLVQATLAPLRGGQVIQQAELDRTLLLLSDIPGVVATATLKPGQAMGTSDLVVVATPSARGTGNATLDNYGNRFTGRARAGATVNVIGPLRHGDVLGLSALTSGRGMLYGRATYETLLNGQGTRMGGSFAALRYEIGEPLQALQAHGTARVASAWAKHPLVRSRNLNLYTQLQYDHKRLEDRVDAGGIRTDRHLDNVGVNLAGDGLLLDGINSWNLSATSGRVAFDNPAAQLADAVTARTEGGFRRWNANFARLQRLGTSSALYLAVSGQAANRNLDSAEKMSIGGSYTVRAYDVGAASGDSGYLATAEYRHDLGTVAQGRLQAVAFIDAARVKMNQNAWAGGVNSVTLSGAGAGLNWEGPNRWRVKAYLAARLGTTPVMVARSASSRLWIDVIWGY